MSERAATGPRSPLHLVVLALLFEESMHPYRMHKLISERGKDDVVNIRSRNSIQQTVTRLEREGLIVADGTEQDGNYPPRTVYVITETGQGELLESLRRMLSSPAREFPVFPAALSFMAIMSTHTAAKLLRKRRAELADSLERKTAATEQASEHLPRILLVENDYSIAMHRAEIEWLDRTLRAMDSGQLTWDPHQLIAQSRHYEQ